MKILFATGGPAMPQMIGGSQRTSDAVIRGLIARGHRVELLAALMGTGLLGVSGRVKMKAMRRAFTSDKSLGYRAWRAWFPCAAAPEVLEASDPDVVVVLAHSAILMAHAVRAAGRPIVMALQDVETDTSGSGFAELGRVAAVANSNFTARFFDDRYGLASTVIHPIIVGDAYRTTSTGQYVTFINPDPRKGLEIAFATARACPDIPFLFVEGWPLKPDERRALTRRVADHPNVTLHASVADMRTIYAKTRIVLAPSQWEEAYGRVATEAQVSGIPVVGSDRGGLPEAIGGGGIVIDWQAPPDRWVSALRSLWEDEAVYASLSEAARRHACRPALDAQRQIEAWEAVLQSTVDGRDRAAFGRSIN